MTTTEVRPIVRENQLRTAAGAALKLPGTALRWILLALLWGYRNLISPLLGPTCRYYPSCSAYAEGAIRTHGAGKGTVLAVARVGRCHPWAAGGVDPVPVRGRWRADPDTPPTDPATASAVVPASEPIT
jgi:putative membrane protein insertion efficiency factor